MSTETDSTTAEPTQAELQAQIDDLQAQLEELSASQADADDGMAQPKMTIIALNGSLDMAYPTLILSSLAAAMDWDVTVFASFWALDILHEEKSKNLKLSSVGNVHMPIPNILAILPGMDAMTTWMMKRQIADEGVETIGGLIERAIENGVNFQACQMTMDLMDYDESEFFDEVKTGVGAGTALMDMADADIQLVI